MRAEMTFNDAAIVANGYTKEDVYQTVKDLFVQRGLRCVSEDQVLSFCDTGHKDDFANIWVILLALIKADWFTDCASSCVFIEDDGSVEDVLCQADEIRQMQAKR